MNYMCTAFKKRETMADKQRRPFGIGLRSAAGAGIGGLMGQGLEMATQGWRYKQQLEQAEKLQKLQMTGQKEMGKFNQGLAIDTWKQTASPQAQVKNYEDAGLNVGLMYGGGGGGGQGGPSAPAGNVTGQSAEMPSGLGIQMGLKMAETAKAMEEADSRILKNEADANYTSGAGTELAYATIKEKNAEVLKLGAETNNEQLKAAGIEWENENKRILAETAKLGQEDTLRALKASADKYEADARSAAAKANVDEATIQENIRKARLTNQLLGVQIEAERAGIKLTKAQTDAVYKGMERVDAEMRKWSTERQQEWQKLSIQEKQADAHKMFAEAMKQQTEFNTGNMAELQRGINIIGDVIGIVGGFSGGAKPVGGFGR